MTEYFDSDGTRMYRDGNKIYIADMYDKMFKPCHNLKPRKDKYKGQNSCKKNLWIKGEKSY